MKEGSCFAYIYTQRGKGIFEGKAFYSYIYHQYCYLNLLGLSKMYFSLFVIPILLKTYFMRFPYIEEGSFACLYLIRT